MYQVCLLFITTHEAFQMKHFNHNQNLLNILQKRECAILWLHVENFLPQKFSWINK